MLERMMAMRLAGLVFGLVLLASAMAWGQSGVQEIQVVVPAGTAPQGIVSGNRGFQVTVSTGNAGVYYGSGYYGGCQVYYGGYPVYGGGYPTYGNGYPVYANGYPAYGGYPVYANGCGYPPAGYGYPTFGGYQVNSNGTSTQLSPGLILFPAAPSVNPVIFGQRPLPTNCPTRLYGR